MTRIVAAPPLAPLSQVTAAEGVDTIIRRVWRLHCVGEVSWRAAGELHDRLNELREALQ